MAVACAAVPGEPKPNQPTHMSRSNPTVNNPHPASRWIEWNGAKGLLRYFDKEINNAKDPAKKGDNVTITQPFTFLVLDELACIRGWHKPSKSNITSNEVRDTREQPFAVRSFKGGDIVNGLYAAIKEKAVFAGGYYQSNVYVGFKSATGTLDLAVLQLNGAALRAWMDFRKKMGKGLYEKAVVINGFTEGHTGDVTFCVPIFSSKDVLPATNEAAVALDGAVLQPFLKEYFARGVTHGAATAQSTTGDLLEGHEADEPGAPTAAEQQRAQEEESAGGGGLEEDDIPF